ncbi:MAG TPA: protein ndvB, partial [Thiolinea sp.]|nr:protein ndvB [Thiolinea sp.]
PVLPSQLAPRPDLILFNGLGGFTADGREYVMNLAPEQSPPAPWSNILANPYFGSVVTEAGQAYTWVENAHEHRLTPWYNDPISDPSGEAFYLRDEDSGHYWSPTPLPCRGAGDYRSRHGFGYSVFVHNEADIYSEVTVFVAIDAPVKCTIVRLHNNTDTTKTLSVTGYVEWVLGDLRPKTMPYVVTEEATTEQGLIAHNFYSMEFAERVAFFQVSERPSSFTADRMEFIGRNSSLKTPAALKRASLSGKTGAGLDPCAALQVQITLLPQQERELVFVLGSGLNSDDTQYLLQRFKATQEGLQGLRAVQDYWLKTLSTLQVQTSDASLNVLVNGWVLYQTLACRFLGRSGYYQSGGAFGFRDQLQDSMALVHAEPQRVRDYLVQCAGHQFQEGDVQHWWHPPSNRGVRTRCSDDYLWLPLAICRYIEVTGDVSVLDEKAGFLTGRALNPGEESYYDLPNYSSETGTLYEHCLRALRFGFSYGEHGLPLMGAGDWNDGMNLVGIHGKGESVWLGFFLCEVLKQFKPLAEQRHDYDFAAICEQERSKLKQALETHAWDGEWYRRAYFDDGTPLGSKQNDECRIDSIAQSWSILSEIGSPERSLTALQSLHTHLVKPEAGLIQLLDPPFDHSALEPGYIKGYVPGVRENGGQYTHAAVWATMAYAQLGDSERAWELMSMLNPVNHSLNAQQMQVYKVEPYVLAADIYAVEPHTGRGGWTWYTGSAGWLYRLITESLLGLRRHANTLSFKPCLPQHWTDFTLQYRFHNTLYHIHVLQEQREGVWMSVDGVEQREVVLWDDGVEHYVEVRVAGYIA